MNEFSMLRFALILFALFALPLKAANVTNLYEAQVVLPDTDKESEQKAREQALEQVLIKVSGQSAIIQNEVIRKAVENNTPYVSQFGYGNHQGRQTLELTFDRRQIRNLLTQANATLWDAQRPSVLVWVVEEANRDRSIIWDQSGNVIQPQLKQAADMRGVPVMMPIGDFEDITAINIPDLWGGFVQPIADASMRYQPDAVLVVRVRQQQGETVQLAWHLFTDKPENLVSSQVAPDEGRTSGSSELAVTEMMNQVADLLAAKYAVQLGGASDGKFAIRVDNIQTTEDFFILERLLTDMTSVATVNASKVHGNKVVFDVNLLSSEAAFKRELSRDNRLVPLDRMKKVAMVTPETETLLTEEKVFPVAEPETLPQNPQAIDVTATVDPSQSRSNQYYWNPNRIEL
ncbi:hypothetical protein C942_02599 [Photobacterium marinum]|uniref:DUF2066 domain-containing protein n=2 Tax=Photobacterium marinum TaxID=1056511 RepID=L8JA60_9GAMM|nr:hypothetical protein C942_02599 [Photobacterium marinum]